MHSPKFSFYNYIKNMITILQLAFVAQWIKCLSVIQIMLVGSNPIGGRPFCNFYDQFGAGHEGPRLNLFNY